MKYSITLLFFLSVWCGAQAACRMRGECATVGGFVKPCPANFEALPLLDDDISEEQAREVIQVLLNRCPNLALDEEGNRLPDNEIRTCCTPSQILSMSESLNMADGVLGRCPACLRNFARQICEMNCSPDQSRFVDVRTETTDAGIEYVNEINYRVHEDFMLDAHSSCSGVIVPQTGMPAINMMCGNAVVCDADAWFGFTGDTSSNPLAPVQVNFLRWPTTEDSMNVRALPCNETYGEDLPCSCVDCMQTCPSGTEPVLPEICTVLSVNCIGFSVGITFFVLSVIVFIIICFLELRSNRNSDSKPPSNISNSEPNGVIRLFQTIFAKIGGISASNPVLMIMFTTWVVFAMLFGVLNLNLTSNPIELWSAPDSQSRENLNYFNSRFGPFYRAAQVFLTFDLESFDVDNVTYGPAFRFEAVQELIRLEDEIINIGRDDGGVTLEQVCYAPLRARGAEPRLEQCTSMSVSVYFGDDRNDLNNNTYLSDIQACINNHFALNCLASWGGGSEPEITFGGYEGDNILSANTLLINFPITNFLLEQDLVPVLEWEQKFIDLMQDYIANRKPDYVSVAFGTERSIEDEIQRVSVAEAVPIAISYVLMFIYVVASLGNVRSCKTWLVDSKIVVAVGSIVVVIAAIFCAMGTMGYAGIVLTLLAINVIPFFVLSIGIDNVFLMVNTLHDIQSDLKSYSDYNENMSFERKRRFVFEKMLGKVGPSIFVASVTQITCFAIGSLANFPAVVTFAIFASISLGFLFVFQITTVVALLSLDYKRASQNRFDVLCCIRKKILDDENPLHSDTPYVSVTKRLMKPYAKFLLRWRVKIFVVIVFMLMVSVSVVLIPQIEIGLDQELALPKDSYVYTYLQAVNELFRLGPPVYFVLKGGLNFTDVTHQNSICGGQLCNDNSLFTQIFLAAQHSHITHISKSSNSWLDDFVDWTSLRGACCKFNTTDGGFCQSTDTSPECAYCDIERNQDFGNGLRPSKEAFQKYIPFFLQDAPTEICNKGGLASYSGSVNYVLDSEGRATVHDTNFMAYHVPLGTSLDYINAVKYGYEISANISTAIREYTGVEVEVFAYSIFYVYYEQYLTMWADTFSSIGYSLIGAMILCLVASGFNILTTFAILINVIMVVINMMGVMYIWNIPLNAVSCVNLIVSIGIAVEFCSHIAYAFALSKEPPGHKVQDALQSVGSTIITGITLTNIPIVVLAFSYTEIIEVFFFRMFLSLVILGFLHGMVFFPVLLSYLEFLTKKKSD
ncbi:NPC intracellular cholesterol transporter 1 homolog 1b-like [Anticarsia gemmatalis]|uniref:NPC intracellular cholesterol transporter 1 homolog 1b-like n=1 Tax=Anticarsia gemmatalis TaxID=129554 RepID=UPI003F760E41